MFIKQSITVLDYSVKLVYQYTIKTEKELRIKDLEDIMIDQGHRLADCEWMYHSDGAVVQQELLV